MKNRKEFPPTAQQLRLRLAASTEDIARFCERWNISEMSVFGSVLRSDFGSDSDIDVLIEFDSGKAPGLAYASMADEIEEMFDRPVDVVTRFAVARSKNPSRQKEILGTAQVIHAR